MQDCLWNKSGATALCSKNTPRDAEIVFEGVRKYNGGNGGSVAYDIVDVKKVFKGNIAPGLVKVVYLLGEGVIALNGVPSRDTLAIFFCKATSELKKYLPKDTGKTSKLLILSVYNEESPWIYSTIEMRRWYSGFGKEFKNKTEVYDFLRAIPGLNVPAYSEPPKVNKPCPDCAKVYSAAYFDSLRIEQKKQHDRFNKKKVKGVAP